MAEKRISLKDRRASDTRGLDALIPEPTASESSPSETSQLGSAQVSDIQASAPPSSSPPAQRRAQPSPSEVSSPISINSDEPESGKTESGEAKPEVAKVTLYIRPDQVLTIEQIQLEQRRKTGKKPDKSDLAQEAFDLLAQKYLGSSDS